MSLGRVLLGVALLAVLALGAHLLRSRPRVRVGERGLLDRSLGWGWIPWDEIEGAYPPSLERAGRVGLRLRVTDRLARVLGRGAPSPATGIPATVEIEVDLAGTGRTALDLLREIVERRGSVIELAHEQVLAQEHEARRQGR